MITEYGKAVRKARTLIGNDLNRFIYALLDEHDMVPEELKEG